MSNRTWRELALLILVALLLVIAPKAPPEVARIMGGVWRAVAGR